PRVLRPAALVQARICRDEWPSYDCASHTGLFRNPKKHCGMGGMQDRGRTRKTFSEESSPLLSRRGWRVAMPTWRRVCRAIQFLLSGAHIKDHKLGLPAQH